jgi:hypothetical protein
MDLSSFGQTGFEELISTAGKMRIINLVKL